MEADESRLTRGHFLRRLGTFAALGLGVAAFPSVARGQSGQCCKTGARCGAQNQDWVYSCEGCGSSCEYCLPDRGNCFSSPCPCG